MRNISRKRGFSTCVKASAVPLIAILVSGCVVGPDYEQPGLVLPASWAGDQRKSKTPAKKPNLVEWWRQLNDPHLNTLVAEAVSANLDVATAKAKIREARASYRQQAGTLLPTADGSGSATRHRSVTAGQPSVYNQYQAGFDASWEVDLFGGNRRGTEAAGYSVQAADEDLADTLVTLIGDVTTYYVQAREYQALIALAERTAKSQRQTAALTRDQLQAGTANGADSASADGQAASTEADIPSYRISYQQSVNRLSVLLGKAPSELHGLMEKRSNIPAPNITPGLGIPADILSQRPDVRAAERRLAQYTAKIGQAESNRYPSISLTGNIASTASNLAELGKKSTISWSFGPSLSVPIFHGGQLKAAVDVAKAQRDQYFVAYQYAVLTAIEDLENAIIGFTQSQQRRAKLSVSVTAYRKAAQIAQELNAAGATDRLDVLEAERSLYSAESNLIQSRASIATYYISLHKALGGGWTGAVDVEKPAVSDSVVGPHLAKR
ncbi:efflux transporter outer membrane subunit [Agrobacterium tumefaciens]|uniref:efflux transporter outer membrane subunit n=1 Tax=Agrobacterium tumefaciens TaxID=358 RepID=UPI0038509438